MHFISPSARTVINGKAVVLPETVVQILGVNLNLHLQFSQYFTVAMLDAICLLSCYVSD